LRGYEKCLILLIVSYLWYAEAKRWRNLALNKIAILSFIY
jgi:hypothetical protein